FRRGIIDKTLFIKKDTGDILLVQVYVDDIIFGSTKKSLCAEFESLTHKKFQMSSMGELTFFLGLQVMHRDDGIFISQDKYVADILKKFDFVIMKTTSTPIETHKALLKDEEAEDMDVHLYRSMIGSLMYLTASTPDIMCVVCAYARFQVTPKVSHLHAVKKIFRYLKGQPKLGLWYPRDSPFDLEASSDSDYAGASLDRKFTTGGCQFLGKRFEDDISDEFGVKTDSCKVNAARQDLVLREENAEFHQIVDFITTSFIHYAITTIVISESSVRSDLHFNDKDEPTTEETTLEKHVSTPSYDPPLSGEDRMQLAELMSLCTNLQEKVLNLEKAKTAQAKEITKSSNEASLGAHEDASKQGRRIEDLDADAKVTLVNETQEMNDDNLMFDTVSAVEVVTTASASVVIPDELTLAQTLIEIKTAKPKPVTTAAIIVTPRAKGIIFHDREEQVLASTKTFSSSQSQLPQVKDKGKGKNVSLSNLLKKKDQVALDEEMARNLEA
ncbi:putative ribonuclease H-like domain-containing protein, partial [Tanacetum coccineum]